MCSLGTSQERVQSVFSFTEFIYNDTDKYITSGTLFIEGCTFIMNGNYFFFCGVFHTKQPVLLNKELRATINSDLVTISYFCLMVRQCKLIMTENGSPS